MKNNTGSWWKRNWKWVVPTGGCLLIILLIVGIFSMLGYGMFKTFNDNDALETALRKAEKNPAVVVYIGQNLEKVGVTTMNIKYTNWQKNTQYQVDIKGTKGTGKLNFDAVEVNDKVQFRLLEVIPDKKDTLINLLD